MTESYRSRLPFWLLVLASLALGSCATLAAEPPVVEPAPRRPPSDLDTLRRLVKISTSKAMCSQEVRDLVTLIKAECGLATGCSAKEVQALTRDIEPHERFLWLMRDMPHVVVYPSEDDPPNARPGDLIVPNRANRLQRLIKKPWLDWTQLLIIGHGGAKEQGKDMKALARANKVRDYIMSTEFGQWAQSRAQYMPNPVITLPYSFPLQAPTPKQLRATGGQNDVPAALELLNKNVLLQKDMPLPEEPGDVSHGVWVFLIECADELQ